MRTLLQSFLETANRLPPKAIRQVLARESQMIESDLMHERVLSESDGFSILIFNRFVQTILLGHTLVSVVLPIEHVMGYRNLVMKMVAANDLPYRALDQFDEVFGASVTTLAA